MYSLCCKYTEYKQTSERVVDHRKKVLVYMGCNRAVQLNCDLISGAENARMEKARLKNAAPNCRGGKCETGKRGNVIFMESQACLLVWFADA